MRTRRGMRSGIKVRRGQGCPAAGPEHKTRPQLRRVHRNRLPSSAERTNPIVNYMMTAKGGGAAAESDSGNSNMNGHPLLICVIFSGGSWQRRSTTTTCASGSGSGTYGGSGDRRLRWWRRAMDMEEKERAAAEPSDNVFVLIEVNPSNVFL